MYSPKITCVFLQIFILSTSTRKTPYCELCEVPGTHTMCLYPTDKMGPDCDNHSRLTLTIKEKRSVLDMHNSYRNRVATGGTNLPTAADMRELVWDDELEIVAQRWANQCKEDHDKCRDSERFPVGQNFGQNIDVASEFGNLSTNFIQFWYLEKAGFNPAKVDVYESDSETANFTQLIWSRTNLIGCGRVSFTGTIIEGHMTAKIENIFCNYGPAGNMIGGYVYATGRPCSACPPGTHCSAKYKGLCSGTAHQLPFVQLGITVQVFVTVTLCIVM